MDEASLRWVDASGRHSRRRPCRIDSPVYIFVAVMIAVAVEDATGILSRATVWRRRLEGFEQLLAMLHVYVVAIVGRYGTLECSCSAKPNWARIISGDA